MKLIKKKQEILARFLKSEIKKFGISKGGIIMPTGFKTGEHTVEIAQVVQGNDFCKEGDIIIVRWDIYVAGRYDHIKDETNIVFPDADCPETSAVDIDGVEQKSYLYHIPEYGILAKAKNYDVVDDGGQFLLDDGRLISNVTWEPKPGFVLATPRKPLGPRKSDGGIILMDENEMADGFKEKPFKSKILVVDAGDEIGFNVGDEILVTSSMFTPILLNDMILIEKKNIILKYA